MFKRDAEHQSSQLLVGTSLGIAASGVTALMIGTLYDHLAFEPFYLTAWDAVPTFLPALLALACFVSVLVRRSAAMIAVLALMSTAGFLLLVLESGWGESICDGDPQQAKQFARFTYAGELLSCVGYAMQLAGSVVLALTRDRTRASLSVDPE